jgi:beta-phosphoglucomutase-like phosphatase (HAD superfamily)
MKFKLVKPVMEKIIQPQGYQCIYGIFTPRVLSDSCHEKYHEISDRELVKYKTPEKVSLWCVGEFAYKLMHLVNVDQLIDDNKAGQIINGKTVTSDFDYKSNVIITSSLYFGKVFSKLTFLLIDLDGTLIDSEKNHYEALVEAGWGPCSFEEYHSMINTTGIQITDEMRCRKNQHMRYDADFMPGAEELIDFIHENNVNHCVVTNSKRETVEKFLEKIPKLNKLSNWVVREDYNKPKPDSECYILARDKFYKDEPIIYGFEDTDVGKRSLLGVTPRVLNNVKGFVGACKYKINITDVNLNSI